MKERYVENKDMILGLMDFRNVAEVISCGPMELRTINMVERINLNNGCCKYALSSANKVGNPFQITCIRDLKNKNFVDIHGNKSNYRVVCIIPKNLECIMNEEDYIEKEIIIGREVKHFSGFSKTEMTHDDYIFLIENNIMEEASLMIDTINGLYLLHGEDNWKDIIYRAYD